MRFDWWTVSFQCNSDITAKLDDNTEHNYAFVLKKKMVQDSRKFPVRKYISPPKKQ